MGFTNSRGARARVRLLRDSRTESGLAGGPRLGRLLRPHNSTPARTCGGGPCWARAAGNTIRVHHHEVGPSSTKIDMRYARAQDGRDCMTYRITGQGVRHEVRLDATSAEAAVRGERLGHATHQSCQDSSNALYDADDRLPVRRWGKAFIAGQLKHAREITRCSRSGESYKRLVPAMRRRGIAPGHDATAPRSCACRSTTPARSRPRAWSCVVRTRPATPT